jgi:cytochrome c556
MKKNIQIFVLITCSAFLSQSLCAAEKLDDKGFEKLMKEVGKAQKGFKKNQDEKNSAAMVKETTRLAEIYTELAGFWKDRKVTDATKWSEESATSATAAASAAKAGEWDKVQTHVQSLMKNCKNCHEAHREKLDDGSSRIK